MDDERAKAVIEDEAETLKELSKSWPALFFIVQATKQCNKITFLTNSAALKPPEELAVQLELILADMEKESTASSHKPCVVPSVHLVATHLTEMKTILGKKKEQQRHISTCSSCCTAL